VFVLLHGIVKRSAQLPEEDIRIAEARMELHGRRMEGKWKDLIEAVLSETDGGYEAPRARGKRA
jgi:hypothetical protein